MHLAPLLERDVLDGFAESDAGRVHQHMQRAIVRDRLVDRCLPVVLAGDVELHEMAGRAELGGHGLAAVVGDVGDDDARTFLGHQDGGVGAKPRGAAGDQRDLALQAIRHVLPPLSGLPPAQPRVKRLASRRVERLPEQPHQQAITDRDSNDRNREMRQYRYFGGGVACALPAGWRLWFFFSELPRQPPRKTPIQAGRSAGSCRSRPAVRPTRCRASWRPSWWMSGSPASSSTTRAGPPAPSESSSRPRRRPTATPSSSAPRAPTAPTRSSIPTCRTTRSPTSSL